MPFYILTEINLAGRFEFSHVRMDFIINEEKEKKITNHFFREGNVPKNSKATQKQICHLNF